MQRKSPQAPPGVKHSSSEEESVSANVPLYSILVVLVCIELLPHTGREDVLIPLVPTSVHHLGKGRIIIRAFETGDIRDVDWLLRCLPRYGEGVVRVEIDWGRRGRRRGRLGAVVEEAPFGRAEALVHDEVVEVVMLESTISNVPAFAVPCNPHAE